MREMSRVRDRDRRVVLPLGAFLRVIRLEIGIVPLRDGGGDEECAAQVRRAALRDRGVACKTLAALLHLRIESCIRDKLLATLESERVADLCNNDRREPRSDPDDALDERSLCDWHELGAGRMQHPRSSLQRILCISECGLNRSRLRKVLDIPFVLEMEDAGHLAEVTGGAQDVCRRKKIGHRELAPSALEQTLPDDLRVVAVGLSLPYRRSRELLGDEWIDELEGNTPRDAGAGEVQVVLGGRFGADGELFLWDRIQELSDCFWRVWNGVSFSHGSVFPHARAD